MRLGGPTYQKTTDPQNWVHQHRALGYSAAYVPFDNPDDPLLPAFVATAAKADLLLAEVGAWSNPISADPTQAKDALALCKRRLAVAERCGARCCVNIAGSRGPKWDGPHPTNLSDDTFALIVDTVREIIDAVKPTRTFYTLETMPWVFPDTADSYLRLIKAIDRKAFAVHLDPVNIVSSPQIAYRTGDLIRECFAKLGPHIRSCHAKDIALADRLTVHLDECIPGTGVLDYAAYLTELSKLDLDTPLMLEHMSKPEDYAVAATHIRAVAAQVGVAIRGG